MNNRLKLIWFALTASRAAIESRRQQIEFELDVDFIESVDKRLQEVERSTYWLDGITISHNDKDTDINVIHSFLRSAPGMMRQLISTVQPSAEDMQRWADEQMEEI
jgi:hypothetical protein